MLITNSKLTLIKGFEGFSAVPYCCEAGKVTIGFGHVVKPGETFTELTRLEAVSLLIRDTQSAGRAVDRLIKVRLNECQQAALLSFTFNVGEYALQASTLRMKLNRGDYEGAAKEFLRWDKIHRGGMLVVSRGLSARRHMESKLFQSECN